MKLAIMQPYFFSYIGYFQLIAAVDCFVIYDNIKYTKKGWINRNRILYDGAISIFSLPLKKDSDFLDVRQREVSVNFDRQKLLRQLKQAYQKAPYFEETYALVASIINYDKLNLFDFLHHSIICVCNYLKLKTKIIISSHININHSLKNQEKVIELCASLGATHYVNPIGGTDLYSQHAFNAKGTSLNFIRSKNIEYKQFSGDFIPWLSIIDVLMFNSTAEVIKMVNEDFDLISLGGGKFLLEK